MVTGWQTIQNSTYHFTDEGAMERSTWAEQDGSRYYLGENGAALTGWQTLDGSTYYFDANGKMATGEVYLGLTLCTFDENGKLISKKGSRQILPSLWSPLLLMTVPVPVLLNFWRSWKNITPTLPFSCWGRKFLLILMLLKR